MNPHIEQLSIHSKTGITLDTYIAREAKSNKLSETTKKQGGKVSELLSWKSNGTGLHAGDAHR